MTDVKANNVYSKPLHQFSTSPMTGYKRDGYCRTGSDDSGNHTVAGTVTEEFLKFSASKGNDLRKQVSLKPGDKWCLCATRWKEAYNARDDDNDPKVPKVALHATGEGALKDVDFKILKQFAAEQESGKGRVERPNSHPDSTVKESQQIGGKEPKA